VLRTYTFSHEEEEEADDDVCAEREGLYKEETCEETCYSSRVKKKKKL